MTEAWNTKTGCELYAGEQHQKKGLKFYANKRNWNLLLIRKGCLKVAIQSQTFHFGEGSLLLIEPGPKRLFTIEENWIVNWIHFNFDAHLQFLPEWPLIDSGIHLLKPPQEDFREIYRLFDNLNRICRVRRKGWYRLGYCMIQEILLWGEMVQEKGLDAEHIEFAAQALSDFSTPRSLNEIAKGCQLSRAGFFLKFKETFGESPGEYRKKMLMNKVREYLEDTDWTLKEIAYKLNLDNPFSLSTRFKKMFGLSPRSYRIRLQNSQKDSKNSGGEN